MSVLKVKATQRRPHPIRNYQIKIPKEVVINNKELELLMGTLFLNVVALLISIYKTIKFRASLYGEDISHK